MGQLISLVQTDRGGRTFLIVLLAVAVLMPVLHLVVPESSGLHLSSYWMTLVGKYMAYAMLALAVDLVWGYCGILSLGHAAFFALGGYAMGMYLMRQIGSRGVYGDPILPDFMVFLNWKELPWFWHGFDMFWFAASMVVVVPAPARAAVRLVCLPFASDRGVPVDHHPGAHVRADARVLPQRHGVRRQQRVHGLQGSARLRSASSHRADRPLRLHGRVFSRCPISRRGLW